MNGEQDLKSDQEYTDMMEANMEAHSERLRRLILRSFCIYAGIVTILRLSGWGLLPYGLVESYVFPRVSVFSPIRVFRSELFIPLVKLLTSWGFEKAAFSVHRVLIAAPCEATIGGYAFTLLPVLIAVYACKTKLNERSRKMVLCFAVCALISHGGALFLLLANFAFSFMMSPGFFKSGIYIVIALTIFMLFLVLCCHRLRESQGKVGMENGAMMPTAFLIGILFFLPTSLSARPEAIQTKLATSRENIYAIRSDDCAAINSRVLSMRMSPDGNMLALGCDRDVTVLGVESRREIFRDNSIRGWGIRFSPSGKYLAVAGEGHLGDKSSLVVYEVEGFRRISEIALNPDDKRKTFFARDVVFRPNEKSLLCVYYSYWERKHFDKEDWQELMSRENLEYPLKWISRCREIEIPSGKVLQDRELDPVNEGAIFSYSFSRDAAALLYVPRFHEKVVSGQRNILVFDTSTWEKTVFRQEDPKYRVMAVDGDDYKHGKIYFIYQHIYFTERDGRKYAGPLETILAELNTITEVSRDIVATDIIGRAWTGFSSMRISPDRKWAAMLCTTDKKGSSKDYDSFDSFILIVNLEGAAEPYLQKYRLENKLKGYRANNVFWLDEKNLVVALRATNSVWQGKILYIPVPAKEEK